MKGELSWQRNRVTGKVKFAAKERGVALDEVKDKVPLVIRETQGENKMDMDILKLVGLFAEYQEAMKDNKLSPEEGAKLLKEANEALNLKLDNISIDLTAEMKEKIETIIADNKITLVEAAELALQVLIERFLVIASG